jgi:hypothetical protein
MRASLIKRCFTGALIYTATCSTAYGALQEANNAPTPLTGTVNTAAPALQFSATPVANGQFKIAGGSCFSITFEDEVDSATAGIGAPVTATLNEDLRFERFTLLPSGSRLIGHVTSVDPARRGIKAEIPGRHWLNSQGAIGIEFELIVRRDDQRFQMAAKPCPGTRLTEVKKPVDLLAPPAAGSAQPTDSTSPARLRIPVIVDKQGDLVVDYHGKRNMLIHLAIDGGSFAAGPFGMAVGPVANGLVGAVSPSYAFGHPADMTGVKEREKGFAVGAVRGLPAVGLITDAAEKGRDVSVTAGDSLVLRLSDDLLVTPYK